MSRPQNQSGMVKITPEYPLYHALWATFPPFLEAETNRRTKQLGAPLSSTNRTARNESRSEFQTSKSELCSPTKNRSARDESISEFQV
ncbi:hypothetical protein ACFX2J_018381 [Malus domestica]